MSEPYDPSKEFPDIDSLKVRDKIDYADLARWQINRCLKAKDFFDERPDLYREHVKGLLSFITETFRDEEFKEQMKGCTETKKVEKPEYWCGVKTLPVKIVEEEITDWEKLYDVCLAKINKMGMGLQSKPKTFLSAKKDES